MGWSELKFKRMEGLNPWSFERIVEQFYPLSPIDLNLLRDITQEIRVPKQTLLIQEGKFAHHLYLIQQGISRVYYRSADREITFVLVHPGECLFSSNSYTHHKIGFENIETLEDSILLKIDQRKLHGLYNQHINIANWGRKLAEAEFMKAEERQLSKLFKTATERYQDLLKAQPNLPNRIKLSHIASYLGISQVTLSRIRAEIK